MKTVLVTGGIGSGKTAVCAYLASKGVMIYDADGMTKSLYDRRPVLVRMIEETLGRPLRDSSGRLDRAALAGIIFSDPAALAQVENIVHPAVLQDFLEWKDGLDSAWCGYGTIPFAVMESALASDKPLFDDVCDKIVLVDAPERIRIARAAERDHTSPEKIIMRMRAQHFDRSKADRTIINDADLHTLHRRIGAAFRRLW